MKESVGPAVDPELQRTAVALAMRLALMALLAYWCFQIFKPFLIVVVWGIILAVALDPLVGRVTRWVGGRRSLAIALLLVLGLTALLVPALALSGSLADGLHAVTGLVESGSVEVPPPPAKVAEWPLIGEQVYETWSLASRNLATVLERFGPQLKAVALWLVSLLKGATVAVLLTVVAIVIAVYLLIRREVAVKTAYLVGAGIGGERGAEAIRFAGSAIGTVATGVVGVAVVQALLAAVGLVLAGVPAAGLWSALILILAVAQMPPLIVLAPAMLYVVATGESTFGVVAFIAWSLVVSLSDAVLKPLFMGRGSEIPAAVILVGAIGGMLLHGLIGLFVGAIVVSTGYSLLREWVLRESQSGPVDGGGAADAVG